MKAAFGKEAFFVAFAAGPADDPLFVMRRDESVVMRHLAVAYGAACGFEGRLGIVCDFSHAIEFRGEVAFFQRSL